MAREWPETGHCRVLKCNTQVLVFLELTTLRNGLMRKMAWCRAMRMRQGSWEAETTCSGLSRTGLAERFGAKCTI